MNVQAQICPKREKLGQKDKKKIASKEKRVSKKSHTKNMTRGGNKVNKNEAATKNWRQNQDLRAGFAEPWIWRR